MHDITPYTLIYQSGLTIAIVMIGITLASAAGAFFLAQRAGGENPNDMSPNTLSDFGPTQAKEGAIIPVIYSGASGVRIPGNIIYFGNLTTSAVKEKSAGGKGSGKNKKVTVGYKYFLDIWQVVCMGQVEFVRTYIAGKEEAVAASIITQNDGTHVIFPAFSEISEFATKLSTVAHVGYEQMFVGENVSFLPTVHYVVKRVLPATINHANMTAGNNPAAIIHDMLVNDNLGQQDPGDIDLTSFNAAADFWFAKDFGLNLVFNSRVSWGDMIKKVLNYVDGTLFIDREGKFKLKHFDPFETPVYGLKTPDFYDFHLMRDTYYKTKNHFQGEFTSVVDDFSGRSLQGQNDATIELVGRQQQSIDLAAFSEINSASQRLWEVLKVKSFPAAQIRFSSDLAVSEAELGDVVSISHTDYQIQNKNFRITDIDYHEIDQNRITFKASEMVEQIVLSDGAPVAGGSLGSGAIVNPGNLANRRIFELPYTDTYGENTAYIILAARPGPETGFQVLFSVDDTNYQVVADMNTFSQHGVLAEAYPDFSTPGMYEIDDTIGILYTPTREDPSFATISRDALFNENRVAIIGNEIFAFQTVAPEGPNDIRLTGVYRGRFETAVESHAVASDIWITSIDSNVLTGILNIDFYLKLVPYFFNDSANEALVFNDHVFFESKALIPIGPSRVEVVRTGTSGDVTVWPITPHYPNTAAGKRPYTQRDQAPSLMDFDCTFFSATTGLTYKTTEFSIPLAVGATTFALQQDINGFKTLSSLVVNIGAADGAYIANLGR